MSMASKALAVVGLAMLGATGGLDGQADRSVEPTRLVAQPESLRLRVGESRPLQVIAVDASGSPLDVPIRISGARRALRVRRGEVTALAAGRHEVVATATGPRGGVVTLVIPVTVDWPAVARVVVQPTTGPLFQGTTVRHSAVAVHDDETQRPGAAIEWGSSNTSVATVDRFGNVTAHGTGAVTISARFEGAEQAVRYDVAPFPASRLEIEGGLDQVRTGDVQAFTAVARNHRGEAVPAVTVRWALSFEPVEDVVASAAPGQLTAGRFVADLPGVYTVVASAGPLQARRTFEVVPRHAVQKLEVVGQGRQDRVRTTDFWVFEGLDGRDYALTGSKRSGGHAYVFDVTDPANIVKTDSIQVDARSVNDVKVSPDGRYATVTREGASNRRNGVVLLDLSNPAHPSIASTFDDGLTGGVHNAFPTNEHVFALSGGDKYVIVDVRDLYHPKYVSEYNHPNSRVHDVWVEDGLAFSAEWDTGLVVVDVGNGRWGGSIDAPVFVTSYPVPSARTHAVFPYRQESTGKYYVFVGDEIMSRAGLAMEGVGGGDYQIPYDPVTGRGGVPLSTQGYIQVIDFTDPERPQMVARYEVAEYGTHNIWVEDDVLYQAYYEGGMRAVDVSGELMGNLYTQGREIAVFKPADPVGYVPNSPMVWSAMPFKGHVFFTDTNSGLWAVKIQPRERPIM